MRAATPPEEWEAEERRIRDEIDSESFALKRYRATFATKLAKEGAPIEFIQAVLGHRYVKTTFLYIDRHHLNLRFYEEVSAHLTRIKENAITQKARDAAARVGTVSPGGGLYECGVCHCRDPFAPPDDVKQGVFWRQGEACSNWNRCLFCDNCVITVHALPKLLAKKREIEGALGRAAEMSERHVGLLLRQAAVIDKILEDDVFDKAEITWATAVSEAYSPEELDALLVGGPGQWLSAADAA
jgi:hypothetical protein